jgi:hypothetical protein
VPNPSPDIDAAHPIQGLRAASAISEMRAERLAAEHYGLEVAAHRLDSECDQNFRLTTPDGRDYVLKIANPAEDRAVTNLQTGALLHLAAADPSLPIPRIGLFIADEVQPGFGRTGEEMWGFARHGVIPDLVTMGMPMGNGHPVAGMAARPEFLAEFGARSRYFNTFGGNPVSAAAGIGCWR